MTSLNSELIIDSDVIRHNISYIKGKIKNKSNFMAVIKSDAYGHLLEKLVPDIDDIVDGYGVVRIDEAKKIRKFSDKKVLLMQGVYSQLDHKKSIDLNLDLVVHNNDQFKLVEKNKNFTNLWMKVNTGMNRLGFEKDEFINIYNEYLSNSEFVLMSHLAASNDKSASSNKSQFKSFRNLSKKMNRKVKKSIANTGCVMNFPNQTYDWVRCGIGMYGGYLNDKNILTSMTLRSKIINLRKIKPGERVGYDGRAVAKKNMLIASVYIGYADGLPVMIKDKTQVMINDQIASVFGRVSMDIVTLDVTDIKSCKVGDWCEFFSKKLPISNIVSANNLISYYFMTGVKSRVKKLYKSNH